MNEPHQDEDNFIITLSDCASVLKRGKFKLLLGTLVFSLLVTTYALIRPVKYEAEATFKEKSNKQSGIQSSSVTSLIFSGLTANNQSEAKAMMTSRKLLERVIKSLGLQATLSKQETRYPRLNNIRENLIVESYYIRDKKEHPLPDLDPVLTARNIEFSGEIPLTLTLTFDTETTFEVFNKDGETLGSGKPESPFSTREFSFTLSHIKEAPLAGDDYTLTLQPLATLTEQLSKSIKIEPEKEDPSLLKVTYYNRDRHLACKTINQLLFCYQDHLRTEHQRVSNEQISYLYSRKKEMRENLKDVIDEYAKGVSAEVSKVGFANSEKAMEFLSSQLQKTWERLSLLELELKRQESLREQNNGSLSKFLSDQTPAVITRLLSQIGELKQQSDAVELALRNSPAKNHDDWRETFQQQIIDLEEVRHSAEEARTLLASLEAGHHLLPSVKIFDNPKYQVRTWKERLDEREYLLRNAPLAEKESKNAMKQQFKGQFVAYLKNLLHFLEVSERTIQERLSHQQSPQFEFQGIDLASAKELYMGYSKELCNVEAQIMQLQFILTQLKDPEFEVSSLSTVLNDSVTNAMVDKAGDYVLALQDESNRSPKEKERLKKELGIQKRFLELHLQQTVQLSHLQESLLKDKIQSLQKASLELIQQQASILENQLADSITAYVHSLKQENELIEQFQQELREEMSKLPKKWASERLLEQELKINSAMVEELTKLVESKNIADNLEMVQSAPVDLAIPTTHPTRPKLLLFALLGGFLGAFFTMSTLLAQLIRRGVPATAENLELSGVHVSGSILRKKGSENLETLRRAVGYLCPHTSCSKKDSSKQSIVFIKGAGQDISEDFAVLLNKRGNKVLLLDMTPGKRSPAKSGAGLFQYLEGEADTPEIVHSPFFDKISTGKESTYANELLSSDKFLTLLRQLAEKYDWIIGITDAAPCSAEAENLFHIFDHTLVNISSETLQQLNPVIDLALKAPSEHKTSFIVDNYLY